MKITQVQQKKGEEFYQELVKKSWEDSTFKEQLITSPIETINTFSGKNIEFTNDISIVVEDQSDSSIIYLNIPAKIKPEDMELSEEQLELVAGGNMGEDVGFCIGAYLKHGMLCGGVIARHFNL